MDFWVLDDSGFVESLVDHRVLLYSDHAVKSRVDVCAVLEEVLGCLDFGS